MAKLRGGWVQILVSVTVGNSVFIDCSVSYFVRWLISLLYKLVQSSSFMENKYFEKSRGIFYNNPAVFVF